MRTEICKFTKFKNTKALKDIISATMNNISNPNLLSADVQAQIYPPPVPLIKAEEEE